MNERRMEPEDSFLNEKKAGETERRIEEINGKTVGSRSFKYNQEGQVTEESFVRANSKTGEIEEKDEPDYLVRNTYGEKGNLFHKIIKYREGDAFRVIERHYDKDGNLMGEEWEERVDGKPTNNRGQKVFENKFNNNGNLAERIGKINTPLYRGEEINKYKYYPEENLVCREQKIIQKYKEGRLAGKKKEINIFYSEDFDNEGNLIMKTKNYKNKNNEKVQKSVFFHYDDKKNLIGESVMVSVGTKDKVLTKKYQPDLE